MLDLKNPTSLAALELPGWHGTPPHTAKRRAGHFARRSLRRPAGRRYQPGIQSPGGVSLWAARQSIALWAGSRCLIRLLPGRLCRFGRVGSPGRKLRPASHSVARSRLPRGYERRGRPAGRHCRCQWAQPGGGAAAHPGCPLRRSQPHRSHRGQPPRQPAGRFVGRRPIFPIPGRPPLDPNPDRCRPADPPGHAIVFPILPRLRRLALLACCARHVKPLQRPGRTDRATAILGMEG